jgi:ribosomal-protein-alanine N-acetyltransferase
MSNALHVRWMIRNDMAAVLEIEQLCFEFPWTEEWFINCLRQRNCIGSVAVDGERIVGYMIYELHKNRFHMLNFAVLPSMQRKGIGTAMHRKVAGKLTAERRSRILCEVRETNLDALMFFKAMGYRAVSVLRDYYDDTTEDAYVMQYRLPRKPVDAADCVGKAPALSPPEPR